MATEYRMPFENEYTDGQWINPKTCNSTIPPFSLDIFFLKNKTSSIITSFTCIGTQNDAGRFAYSFFDIVLYEIGTFRIAVCSK